MKDIKYYNSTKKIRALVLDVDGVILGEKEGYNFPEPHNDVAKALKDINKTKPVILCTAKPYFSVEHIVKKSELYSAPHVCEAGALIYDAKTEKTLKQDEIDNDLAVGVIEEYLKKGFYTEFYTEDNYFAQDSEKGEITHLHAHSLLKNPILVDDLALEAQKHKIIKIIVITKDESCKSPVENIFHGFSDELNIYWGVHPIALPAQFAVITSNRVSKRISCIEVVEKLGISFDNILGVGDGTGDWQFMELCGYAAAMGNGSDELKQKVMSKGEGKGFVAPAVDENGIIKVFEYFRC